MDRIHISCRRPSGGHQDLHVYAGRTLDLLSTIEKTVKYVSNEASLVNSIASGVRVHLAELVASPPDQEIDPTGRVCELLTKAADSAQRSHNEALLCRNSARADGDLHDDDGVVDSFSLLVSEFADLHNVLEDLRETIETLDALRSPVDGRYSDVESLLESLRA